MGGCLGQAAKHAPQVIQQAYGVQIARRLPNSNVSSLVVGWNDQVIEEGDRCHCPQG